VKKLIILITFLSAVFEPKGIINIENEDDIRVVKNNVMQFWREHSRLIKPLSKGISLSEEQLEELRQDRRTWVARDFRSSQTSFKRELDNTIEYVKSHYDDISRTMGGKEATKFFNALILLERLYSVMS
jgi:hypothetical protein